MVGITIILNGIIGSIYMADKLNKSQRSLLLRFRTALKEANLYFEGKNIHIGDAKTGHYVKFSSVLTDSEDSDLELFVYEYVHCQPRNAWRTTKGDKIFKE